MISLDGHDLMALHQDIEMFGEHDIKTVDGVSSAIVPSMVSLPDESFTSHRSAILLTALPSSAPVYRKRDNRGPSDDCWFQWGNEAHEDLHPLRICGLCLSSNAYDE